MNRSALGVRDRHYEVWGDFRGYTDRMRWQAEGVNLNGTDLHMLYLAFKRGDMYENRVEKHYKK